MKRFVLSLVILLSLSATIFADGITLTQSLDKDNIAFTDSALFEISLQWEGSQVAYLFGRPLSPELEGLRVARFSSAISSSMESGKEITTKNYQYVLEPTSAGVGRIEPITISYVSWPDSIPGQLVTEAATVEVGPQIIIEEPQTSLWWVWVIAGLVLVGVIVTFVLAYIRSSRRRPEVKKTPRESLLENLAAARSKAGYDMKRFQGDVYKILVTYIADEYNIDAASLKGDELVERLMSAGVNENKGTRVQAWLVRAEKDKYSPASAGPGETVRLESEIREFFEKW